LVVKLSTLRIAPELDPSKYLPGAAAVDRANDQMADSAARVSVLMDGASGSVSRLGQSYVGGYADQVRFEKGLNSLDRALATGNATMAQAEAILEGMMRKTGLMAAADDLAAQGKHQLAAAVVAVNARLATEEAALDISTAAYTRNAAAVRMSNMQRTNLIFQLNDIGVSLASGMNPLMVLIQQGSQIATIYSGEQGGIGRAFSETAKMAGGLVTKLWPVAAVLGIAAGLTAGLTHEINELGGAQVSFGDTALAMWELFAEGIYRFAEPAVSAIGGWIHDAWETSAPVLKDFGNYIVGGFDLAYRNVKTIWAMLPAALGDVTVSTANAVIAAIEDMINKSRMGMISFLMQAQTALGPFGGAAASGAAALAQGPVSFGRLDNPNEGAAKAFEDQMRQNQADVLGTDYMGNAFGAIADRAQQISKRPSKDEIEAAEKEGERIAEAYDKVIQKADERIAQLGVEAEVMGMTDAAAMMLRNTHQLLAEAEATGMEMTPERIAQMEALAEQITEAELKLKGLQIAMENRTPWEVMAEEVANLNDLMERGALTAEDYWIEMGKAAETMVSGYASAADNLLGNVEKITEAMGLEGRKAFEVQKGLSIARAVVAGGESIVNSYNAGAAVGGPIVGGIFAGVAAAATAAQIAAIASTTYQSKSISAPASKGGAGAGASATSPGQQSIELTIVGSGMIGVEELAKQLTAGIADGGHKGLVKVIHQAA
jgi:hypothetical protein